MERLTLLPLMVAVPLGGAFVTGLVGDRRHGLAAGITCGVMVALVAGAGAMIGLSGTYGVGSWPGPYGIELRIDALAVLVLLLVASIGLAAAVYSTRYIGDDTEAGRYYTLFLLLVAGMNGVASAGDLFNLYVFVEIASMASYALVAFGGRAEQLEASFKYAVLGTIASTLILLGIGALYGLTGTLNMAHLAEGLSASDGTLGILATGMLLSGFGLKAALVPFHAWLPDAHPAAPSPVSAMLSGVLIKVLGAYVLARLVFNILAPGDGMFAVLRGLGVASMVIGGVGALGQRDAKRLLAYSSVEQSGYIVLAFGLGTGLGAVAAIFHVVNHAVFKALLFLDLGVVERATGTRQLPELGDLARRMPGTCATSLIGALSNAGLPPFGGFWSKLLIVLACVQAGAPELAVAAVLVSVITLAFQVRLQREVFFGAGPDAGAPLQPIPWTMRLPSWGLAIACCALGLLCLGETTDPLLIGPAADALTAGRFGIE